METFAFLVMPWSTHVLFSSFPVASDAFHVRRNISDPQKPSLSGALPRFTNILTTSRLVPFTRIFGSIYACPEEKHNFNLYKANSCDQILNRILKRDLWDMQHIGFQVSYKIGIVSKKEFPDENLKCFRFCLKYSQIKNSTRSPKLQKDSLVIIMKEIKQLNNKDDWEKCLGQNITLHHTIIKWKFARQLSGQKTYKRHYYLSTLPRPSIPFTDERWNKSY